MMNTEDKHKVYYYLNRLMSNTWAWFYIAIGSRGRGKTTSAWRWVLKRYLRYGEKFVWLRLTESPLKKMAGSRGATLIPKVIMEELGIESVRLSGTIIYIQQKGADYYEECGIMDAVSTFYTTKGSDFTDYTNIVLDEFNRESGEHKTFDIVRGFVNEIETIARTRTNVRVLMLANVIDEVSDILSIFGFQPKEYGLYKLRRKHCVIEYLEDSPEWIKYSKNSLARSLLDETGETKNSFENRAQVDYTTIRKYNNRYTPLYIFYLTNTQCVEFYAMGSSIVESGLLVDRKIRNENVPKFKFKATITANALYDKDIIDDIKNLLAINRLYFVNTIQRYNFILAFDTKK